MEIKYKSLIVVKFKLLEADNFTLYKLYQFFINQTSYNSLTRFSASYFAKRTNITDEVTLNFLLKLVKQGTIKIRYELCCNNCDRVVYSSSSSEEVKKLAKKCLYCSNGFDKDEIDDSYLNIYFKVKDIVNIPLTKSLTEKDKVTEYMQQIILDLFKRINEIEEECSDFFADMEYYKIKDNITTLEFFNNTKASEMAEKLRNRYREIYN